MSTRATIYGVISTLEKYTIEDAKRILFQMVQEMEHGKPPLELEAQPSAPTVEQIMEVVRSVDDEIDYREGIMYEPHLSNLRARLTKLLNP
jgi:hypothetical protein